MLREAKLLTGVSPFPSPIWADASFCPVRKPTPPGRDIRLERRCLFPSRISSRSAPSARQPWSLLQIVEHDPERDPDHDHRADRDHHRADRRPIFEHSDNGCPPAKISLHMCKAPSRSMRIAPVRRRPERRRPERRRGRGSVIRWRPAHRERELHQRRGPRLEAGQHHEVTDHNMV